MVNISQFTERLKKIMDFYNMSASTFADKVGVQRSSISHVLSGRNKPSLDFVLKVTTAFKDVDMYWLVNGKGNFPSQKENPSSPTPSLFENNQKKESEGKTIERIVVFYTDGTFSEYHK
jgi:transcriptional regulator with XRE-family HTH domain